MINHAKMDVDTQRRVNFEAVTGITVVTVAQNLTGFKRWMSNYAGVEVRIVTTVDDGRPSCYPVIHRSTRSDSPTLRVEYRILWAGNALIAGQPPCRSAVDGVGAPAEAQPFVADYHGL